jgi:hypothetical protein
MEDRGQRTEDRGWRTENGGRHQPHQIQKTIHILRKRENHWSIGGKDGFLPAGAFVSQCVTALMATSKRWQILDVFH